MKTKKTFLLGLIVLLIIGLAAACKSTDSAKASQTELNSEERNVIRIILEGLAESTQEAAEIQRQMTAQQQREFLDRYASLTETDAGLEKVREAKGVQAKLSQIFENLQDSTKSVQEREQARRTEINERTYAVNPYLRARQEVRSN